MEVVNFSSNAKCLSAKYIDHQNIEINNFSTKIEQEFTIFNIEALNSANDVKIGGYNALYLTEPKYGEDILSYKRVLRNEENIIVTDIFVQSSNDKYFLYINIPNVIGIDTKTTCDFVEQSLVKNRNNTYFEIELIDERHCRILHKVTNNIFYLTVNDQLDTFFTNLRNTPLLDIEYIDEYTFLYILDKKSGRISFYKPINGSNYVIAIDSAKKLALNKIESASFTSFNSSNTLNIRYTNKADIHPKLNTSWVSYNDINSLEINPSKSSFKNKNNYLLSTQYSFATGSDITLNILPLKNQLTKEGISQRGDYLLNIPNKKYPQTFLRDYNNIHIGSKQEQGISDISLTYNFYNTEFIFKPDEYTIFVAPDSLYPYARININDTLFAINGSLGGDSPHSSDKIYTKNIQSSYPEIGGYLCTWLSGGNDATPGVWVDRYYNTSKISPIDALTATAVKLYDFTSNVEESIRSGIIINDNFFDVKSDLTIEPNREYIYQRLGSKYISSFLTHLDNDTIFDRLTARTSRGSIEIPTRETEVYNFKNKYHYSFIDSDVSSFTFSFWLKTDWEESFGYQLAGNFNNKGFGIFNDEAITPFIMIPDKNSVYVYNTDFKEINKIDFQGKIRNIIRINPLDDIYVVVDQLANTEEFTETTFPSSILYKLKSNGTVFDSTKLFEAPSYINYINTETEIFFLLDGSGNIAIFNIIDESIKYEKISIPREFGIDFDIRSIGFDKFGNVVGFRGEKCAKINDNEHVFVLRSGVVVKESDDHTSRTVLLSSASIVYDFAVDNSENIYVLHNRFLSKYTSQRDLVYKRRLDSKLSNISIDIVREYTEDGLKQYPVILSINSKKEALLTKIDENTLDAQTVALDNIEGEFYNVCRLDTIFNYYNLTNYSLYLKNNQPKNNTLKFRIEIPNKYNNRDNLRNTMSVDISKLSVGKHHFVYRLDTISGNITLFVDGRKIDNKTFDPGEYALTNTLYNTFNVGAATYFNGTIINNYIKQIGQYFCRNIIIEQPRLYGKGIDDIDIKFLNLSNLNTGELIGTLPCGQRNQVEQIQRFFKWQVPGSKSNKINIRVKTNMSASDKINAVLKEIIRRDVSNSLPASVNINEIIFDDV